jgi:hypothetical protein
MRISEDIFWKPFQRVRKRIIQNLPCGRRLAKALTYAGNQRPYMMTYLEDGRCSILNNLSENSIRSVTVGRRNWLFCDTIASADASMMVFHSLKLPERTA